MRFGTFLLPISLDPALDGAVIEQTLREIDLTEQLGFDSVWLTEHHFSGLSPFAAPIVLAAAAATRTRTLRIGFAVLQMALHHPVLLAEETALLDHLSGGRLLVGTGRGTAYGAFEYVGFGVTMDQGREMLAEAEELLVKAWTQDDVRHDGKFWRSSFPRLRPRPLQRPHPPLLRACDSDASIAETAKAGRPLLLNARAPTVMRDRLKLYRDTMLAAGFDEAAYERAIDATWVRKHLYIADSRSEARERVAAAVTGHMEKLRSLQLRHNPPGDWPAPKEMQWEEHSTLYGTAEDVAEQVAEVRDAGFRNVMLQAHIEDIPAADVERSMRLFQEKVTPHFAGRGKAAILAS